MCYDTVLRNTLIPSLIYLMEQRLPRLPLFIGTPTRGMSSANIFGDSVEPPEDEQATNGAVMEHVDRHLQEREAQT